jgi:hypothetical protein
MSARPAWRTRDQYPSSRHRLFMNELSHFCSRVSIWEPRSWLLHQRRFSVKTFTNVRFGEMAGMIFQPLQRWTSSSRVTGLLVAGVPSGLGSTLCTFFSSFCELLYDAVGIYRDLTQVPLRHLPEGTGKIHGDLSENSWRHGLNSNQPPPDTSLQNYRHSIHFAPTQS